jgi:hypothetical protein
MIPPRYHLLYFARGLYLDLCVRRDLANGREVEFLCGGWPV